LTLGLALALLAVSPVALATTSLSGTYKSTVTNAGTGPLMVFNGTWTITFKTTGKYKLKKNGAFVDSGKFTISGSKFTIKSTSPSGFFGCKSTGKYSVKLTNAGKKLKFTVINDAMNCFGRTLVLTKHAYTKT
jgi:hypothetical protein